jgi:hypothetical protein
MERIGFSIGSAIEFPARARSVRGAIMRFAKIVFWIAAIWGVLTLAPLYFMFDLIGRNDPPAITHPGFFYGFVGAGLAWQIVFFVIATDPVRYRPLMIPSVLEKISYVAPVVILVLQGRMHPSDLVFAGTDLLLGVLFVLAYLKTRPQIA